MADTLLYAALRTPIGRAGGALAGVRADDLAATVLRAVIDRTGIDPSHLDDVILGCSNQAGEDNRNVARMAALLAGLPVAVPGQTVNRLCGSGLQAVASASQAIRAGEAEVILAGGVESMTRAPYAMLKSGKSWSRIAPPLADTTVGWRFVNPRMRSEWTVSLGQTAENVAEKYGIGRQEQEAFALESQQRTKRAIEAGWFDAEIIPLEVECGRGKVETVGRDEHPRPDVTLEALRRLSPAFTRDGTVTAGTSSGINDGAAALLVAREDTAATSAVPPGLASGRILGTAVAGVDPALMGLGPVPATRKLLARLGLTIEAIDLVELNEAFAAQSIACIRELELDPGRVNIAGGAIALGHPLGCSGARILVTLLHALHRTGGRLGLATMCIGVGQGIAMLVERI